MAGREPTGERADMIAFAEEFAPHVLAAVRAAEPLGEVARHRMPSSQRRRYDKMRRFPEGLLVFGDAICSFNPIYGQGMTVAALEALALRDCLCTEMSIYPGDSFGPPQSRSAGLAHGRGSRSRLPQILGSATIPMRLSNWYTDRVLAAAKSDSVVTEGFFRVINLVDPPARMLRPSFLMRVAATNRRRREDDPHPGSLSR